MMMTILNRSLRYAIVVDAVTKKVNIIMTAAKKLPLVIPHFLL